MKIYFLRIVNSTNENFIEGEYISYFAGRIDDFGSGPFSSNCYFLCPPFPDRHHFTSDNKSIMDQLKTLLSCSQFQGVSVELVEFTLTSEKL